MRRAKAEDLDRFSKERVLQQTIKEQLEMQQQMRQNQINLSRVMATTSQESINQRAPGVNTIDYKEGVGMDHSHN